MAVHRAFVLQVLLAWLVACGTSAETKTRSAAPTDDAPPPASGPVAPAPVERPSRAFDDVPRLDRVGDGADVAVLFAGADRLPSETVALARVTLVQRGIEAPPLARAAGAVALLCGGPPLSRLASNGAFAPEALADILLDGERLRAWLDCGRSAAKATAFTYHTLALRMPGRRLPLRVTLLPSLEPPSFFVGPATPVPGLRDLRCARAVSGVCDEAGLAIGRVEHLGMVAVGQLAALVELARTPGSTWTATASGLRPTLAAEQTRGRDVELMSEGADSAGFLDVAVDGVDPSVYDKRDALVQAIASANAVAISTIDSSYEGPASFLVGLPSPAGAKPVVQAIEDLRVALLNAPPNVATSSSIEEDYNLAMASMMRRAILAGKVEAKDDVVRLETEITANAGEALRLESYRKARVQHLGAMGRVLTAIVDGRAPSQTDLELIGGPRLPELMTSRAGRTRATSGEVEPLQGFSDVQIPKARSQKSRGTSVELLYPDISARTVDDLLDTFIAQGFEVALQHIPTSGPVFRATRREQSLFVRVRSSSAEPSILVGNL